MCRRSCECTEYEYVWMLRLGFMFRGTRGDEVGEGEGFFSHACLLRKVR